MPDAFPPAFPTFPRRWDENIHETSGVNASSGPPRRQDLRAAGQRLSGRADRALLSTRGPRGKDLFRLFLRARSGESPGVAHRPNDVRDRRGEAMETTRPSPTTTRTLLAWGFIGILGVLCLVVGIKTGASSGGFTFEAVKFAGAGIILLAIGTYKVARSARQR